MLVTSVWLFAVVYVVLGAVIVENPLNGQFPLIARRGQAFSWAMSSKTFASTLGRPLLYSASGLPDWLSFDGNTLMFSGIPGIADGNAQQITVTASDMQSTNTSSFVLYVGSISASTVQKNISQQFYEGNPTLSAAYLLAPGSALSTGNPALRVPFSWSFSIGFRGDVFSPSSGLYYGALLSDRTPLPPWVVFDPSLLTFDGVAPSQSGVSPLTIEIALFASELEGYSSDCIAFDLIVADHELSTQQGLPTIDAVSGSQFNITVDTPADLSGVLVDGNPIQPANVSDLRVDVSAFPDWFKYDANTRTLFGYAPDSWKDRVNGQPRLPVKLTSTFNQTLHTSMSVAIGTSFFSAYYVGILKGDPGDDIHFDLTPYVSKSEALYHDVTLSASFEPEEARNFFAFDPSRAQLTGYIPLDSDIADIRVDFVAYSSAKHSTSHAVLSLISPMLAKERSTESGGLSRSRTVLMLSLVFGIVGGALLAGAIVFIRWYVRRRRSTTVGEGARVWTAGLWRYGAHRGEKRACDHCQAEQGYITNAETGIGSTSDATEVRRDRSFSTISADENFGVELQRFPRGADMMGQIPPADDVTKKRCFFRRIGDTIRSLSTSFWRSSSQGTDLSKPISIQVTRSEVSSSEEIYHREPPTSISYNEDDVADSGLTSLTASPSDSASTRPVPRRRADFAPPHALQGFPAPSLTTLLHDSAPINNMGKFARSHNIPVQSPEAIQVAERARVERSTALSPRPLSPNPQPDVRGLGCHTFQSYEKGGTYRTHPPSLDDIDLAMHYVHTLGESSKVPPVTSSQSLESSHWGQDYSRSQVNSVPRFLVRVAEKFKFGIPIQISGGQRRKLEARLVSGDALPAFMQVELKSYGSSNGRKRAVEFYGVPAEDDIGELHIGIFNMENDECLVRVVVEVIGGN
ncbi:hypothetical protein BKA83DRAFT_105175 [Pisolithus microcarpus]|nr:hypothetical protein BKA83DRAFT_105175 [Pisolithus microcarpus]